MLGWADPKPWIWAWEASVLVSLLVLLHPHHQVELYRSAPPHPPQGWLIQYWSQQEAWQSSSTHVLRAGSTVLSWWGAVCCSPWRRDRASSPTLTMVGPALWPAIGGEGHRSAWWHLSCICTTAQQRKGRPSSPKLTPSGLGWLTLNHPTQRHLLMMIWKVSSFVTLSLLPAIS